MNEPTFDISFTLQDAKGVDHAYTGMYIPGLEATEVGLRLLSALGEPLAALLSASGEGPAADDNAAFAQALGPALKTMDPKTVHQIARQVLKHMIRDGERLAADMVFDKAYRGNVAEFFEAVMKTVVENRLIPLLGT